MPCVGVNKLVYNIQELPSAINITNGDKFIIHSLDGPYLLDYENFIITLSQTTFAGAFVKHTTDIVTLSAKTNTEAINEFKTAYDEQVDPILEVVYRNIDELGRYVGRLNSEYNEIKARYGV